MIQTLKVKLKVSREDVDKIFKTFQAWNIAWQKVANWSFKHDGECSQKLANQATYFDIRNALPNFPSSLVQAARIDALAKIKAIKKNTGLLDKVPKLNKNTLRYDPRSCSVKGTDVALAICGGRRIKVSFEEYPRFTEFRSNYRMLSPSVFYSDGVFWGAFPFEIPESPAKNKNVTGLDFGQRNFVATSDGRIFKCKQLNRLRRKTQFLKRQLQKRGTKNARRKLHKLRSKVRRQSDNVVHCLSKHILSSIESDFIAVEKLKLPKHKGPGKKAKNRRKYAVPIGKCIEFLSYKAPKIGKLIVKVSPYMTSQDDCRGLSRGIRKRGLYIGSDGKLLNADINAACNIAWKATEAYDLNNPSVPFGYGRQVAVTQPIACKSLCDALLPIKSCNSNI